MAMVWKVLVHAMIFGKMIRIYSQRPMGGLVANMRGIRHHGTPIGALANWRICWRNFPHFLITHIQQKFKHTDDVLGVWPLQWRLWAWEIAAEFSEQSTWRIRRRLALCLSC